MIGKAFPEDYTDPDITSTHLNDLWRYWYQEFSHYPTDNEVTKIFSKYLHESSLTPAARQFLKGKYSIGG